MDKTKADFIRLAIECNVLKFGQFTLKSGRISPYFFNAGLFCNNYALQQVGRSYAQQFIKNNIKAQHLFGPAYKGLPLATATAIALAEKNIPITVTFNRKEIKNHGETGILIGAPICGETVIIDDVITAGTAFREAKQLIDAHGGQVVAVIIALDRCERGSSEKSILDEIKTQGIAVYSVINLFDLIDYLRNNNELKAVQDLLDYQKIYGA